MLFWFDCHEGKDIRWPELSNLHSRITIQRGIGWSTAPEVEYCVPILAPWCTVQVDDQLKAVITGPGDRVSEIRKLSLNVRFPRADLPCPISYWQPDMVQPVSQTRISTQYEGGHGERHGVPSSCNSLKVPFGYPGVPMLLERQLRRVFVLILPERPLVDDSRVSSVVEYAWGDPGLCE
jgi:hypothetical protein